MRFLLLFAVPCLAQPVWTPVAGPFEYFRYGSGKAIERADRPRPPMTYRFVNGPAPARKVCAIENRPGAYWYTPAGAALQGTYPTTNPTEFNVTALQKDIRGFAVTAAFGGVASGAGSAVEVVYFTDRACSDGGVEYGFSRDLATESILVYWSTYANCGNDAASVCRKTDHPSLGEKFSNVQQEDAGSQSQHGFRIFGLSSHFPYTFRMLALGESFHIEVLTGDHIATVCSDSAGGPRHPCSFDRPVEAWFPIGQLAHGSGYIVTGTQTVGHPVIDKTAGLMVSDILVGR